MTGSDTHMDGIRAGGLGYPGGRSGFMGNSAMAGEMSHGFGSLGYAGGRTGFAAQSDNHAFGNTAQEPIAQAANNSNNSNNNGPLKAINSKVFGRGTFELPFFGAITPAQAGIGLLLVGFVYHQYGKK